MILVTGAGGKTGKAVLKALVARGEAVRAFVRSAAHHAALKAIGVHNVELGEMDDPRAWSQAIRGTSAVYHICPNVRLVLTSCHLQKPSSQPLAPMVSGDLSITRCCIRRSRRCRIIGPSCGSRRCCSAQGLMSPSCSPRPTCRI